MRVHKWDVRAAYLLSVLLFLYIFLFAPGLAPGKDTAEKSSGMQGPPEGAPTDQDPGAYEGLSREQIERLERGEVVILEQPEVIEGREMVTAAIIFNQDIDTVFSLINQGWRQEEFLPHLDSSELHSKGDGKDRIDIHVKILWIEIDYRVMGDYGSEPYRRSWSLDPEYDNDMKEVSGFWQLYWIDPDHTLARYGTLVETGFWLPGFVQEFLTKRDLPKALGAEKEWIDSGGSYRKPGYEKR